MEHKRKIDCPAKVMKIFVVRDHFPSFWEDADFFIHVHEVIGFGLDKKMTFSNYDNGKLDSEIFETLVDEIQIKEVHVDFKTLIQI